MTAVEFPFRFSFEQARRQAKDLQRALRVRAPQALDRLRAHHPEGLKAVPTQLADAQLVVARQHGFESWAKLKAYAKPQTLYQSEMITEGVNEIINGPWEGQVEMLHQLATEALANCGIKPTAMKRAGHMGNFGYSDYGLAVVTGGQTPSHLVTVHYTYDDIFPFDEMHRQVASLCAWLFALGRDTDLDIQTPVADDSGALCQRIDHRPEGPAAVCTVQRWVAGRDIIGEEVWEGWDLKGDRALALEPGAVGKMGALLRQIHAHGQTWARPDGFNRMQNDWQEDLTELEYRFWKKGDKDPKDLALVQQVLQEIAQTRKTQGEPWGLSHGDFRAHNCVVDGDSYKAIDFDLCALSFQYDDIGWFLGDISDPALRQAFLEGYRGRSGLEADFLRLVEGAFIAARMRRCAWGGRYPEGLVEQCRLYEAREKFLLRRSGPEPESVS